MEGHCSTGQRSQWAVVPMEEKEEEQELEEEVVDMKAPILILFLGRGECFNSRPGRFTPGK